MTSALALGAILATALPAAAGRTPPCPAGRYLVEGGSPLIAGQTAPAIDAVVVDGAGALAIASGCPVTRARLKGRRAGTTVRAKWRKGECAGLAGRVRLTARVDPACRTLSGRLAARRFGRKFTARRSECGDGVSDRDGGEQCPGLEAAAALAAVEVIADVDRDAGVTDGEVSQLPNGVPLARTRLEIELADGVTVGAVNALLAGVGAEIMLTLDGLPFLFVRIPDPGTLEALDAVVARLEGDPAVVSVSRGWFPGLAEVPANYRTGDELSMRTINHHLPVRAPAAWNARGALHGPAERPTLVIQDTFGDGVPNEDYALTGLVADDFATGAPAAHGYHVLGIATATFGSSRTCYTVSGERDCVTGMMPGPIAARAVDLRAGVLRVPLEGEPGAEKVRMVRDAANARMLTLIRDTPGHVIVNTSLHDCGTGICGRPDLAAVEARKWIRKTGLLREVAGRLVHLTASGNVGERGSPEGADASTASAWSAAALLPGLGDDRLANLLVVDNATGFGTLPAKAECLDASSKSGGHVSAMGTSVFSFGGARRGARIETGTSMATPQVAGLAAYLWSLDPAMSVADVVRTIRATATPIVLSTAPACSAAAPAPVIDAYGAVLALDQAALPAPATAPLRTAILDVAGGDGRFDAADLARFLQAFIQGFVDAATHGPPVAPAARDWSRHDLNGDGFTGGPGRGPFDLDRVGSTQYGAPRLTTVSQRIEATMLPFDETGLTDLDILCYYAYSGLYRGTPAERTRLLDPALCGVAAPPFDYGTIAGAYFGLCVTRAHVEIREQDGSTRPDVWEHYCTTDQVPNFGSIPLPDPAAVAGNYCLSGKTPTSQVMFDPTSATLTGSRTEWEAAFPNDVYRSDWSATIDTARHQVTELRLGNCWGGTAPFDERSLVLRNLPATEVRRGFARFALGGRMVCDAIDPAQLSIRQFRQQTASVKRLECGDDPHESFVTLELWPLRPPSDAP